MFPHQEASGLIIGGMGELPTGTITMLFSDIEGSTMLLSGLGDRYGDQRRHQRRRNRDCRPRSRFAHHDVLPDRPLVEREGRNVQRFAGIIPVVKSLRTPEPARDEAARLKPISNTAIMMPLMLRRKIP